MKYITDIDGKGAIEYGFSSSDKLGLTNISKEHAKMLSEAISKEYKGKN